eukprot:1156620-Pelagomonas_calceolata.AAC.10
MEFTHLTSCNLLEPEFLCRMHRAQWLFQSPCKTEGHKVLATEVHIHTQRCHLWGEDYAEQVPVVM